MANVNHSTLTDPYLHEPKGVASAPSGSVYLANGTGGGSWTELSRYVCGFVGFDASTPAYQHSVTTTYSALNPTFSLEATNGFSAVASPNARLVYTGSEDIKGTATFILNYKNSSGTQHDLEIVFYKNGSIMNGGHVIVTAQTGVWSTATLTDLASLSTNDYIEVFVKGSTTFTLDVASANLTILGVPN
jgi:hypothetical protein